MTKTQLTDFGIIFDTWTSLSGLCHQVIFSNESHIYTNRNSYQFYFDTSSHLLFVRQIEYISDSLEDNSPYIINFTTEDNKNTKAKLFSGGAIDNTVGVYHSVYDLNSLIGLF